MIAINLNFPLYMVNIKINIIFLQMALIILLPLSLALLIGQLRAHS